MAARGRAASRTGRPPRDTRARRMGAPLALRGVAGPGCRRARHFLPAIRIRCGVTGSDAGEGQFQPLHFRRGEASSEGSDLADRRRLSAILWFQAASTRNDLPRPAARRVGAHPGHRHPTRSQARHATPTAACAAASRVWGTAFPFRARKNLAGLRLVADDVPWSVGDGPEVQGAMASLLLVLTGRSAGVVDLTGDGVPILADRLSHWHPGGPATRSTSGHTAPPPAG